MSLDLSDLPSEPRLTPEYRRRHRADYQLMMESLYPDWDGPFDDPKRVRYGPHDWDGLAWVLTRAEEIDDGVRRYIQCCVVPRYRGYDSEEWDGLSLEEYCRFLCSEADASTDWRDAIDSCQKENADPIGDFRDRVEGFL